VADSLAEFQRLLQQRDLAAYRVVSATQVVIDFFEAQDYESALELLKKSQEAFRQADQKINAFTKSHLKKASTKSKTEAA
jgi:hypothetical protein